MDFNKDATNDKFMLRTVSQVEADTKQWLIPGYIPWNDITLLCGTGGSGKTTLWCSIAADISRGEIPDFAVEGYPTPALKNNRVLFLSAEDSVKYVLRNRLERKEANLDNIFFVTPEDSIYPEAKLGSETFTELIKRYQPALLILDPVQSFLNDRVDMSKRNNIRQALDPLAGLCEKYETTCILVMHCNKLEGASGRRRISDSSDFWDRARSVLIAGEVPDSEERYLSHEKCNYASQAPTLLYQIEDTGIEITGTSDLHDFDYVHMKSKAKRKSGAVEEAEDFIRDFLQDEEKLVSDLDLAAENYGISNTSLKRAKAKLAKEGQIVRRQEVMGKGGNKKHYISMVDPVN